MTLLCYCTFAPRGTNSPWFQPAEALVTFAGGERSVKYSWIIVFVLHPLETIYTYVLCRRHKTPFLVGVSSPFVFVRQLPDPRALYQAAYILGTLALGYPMWSDFRRRVQAARINSVKSH